jgi:hypothetical protein
MTMDDHHLLRRCAELRVKINTLTDGEYALSKADVDRLREELGQAPLPSLQATLDEKASQYVRCPYFEGGTVGLSQESVPVPPFGSRLWFCSGKREIEWISPPLSQSIWVRVDLY